MNTRVMMVVSMVLALSLMLVEATFAQDTDDGETTLVANLTGAAERTPTGGDPDGAGTATVTMNPDTGEVCWEIEFTGIDQPSASHIHRGSADVAGPVVVPFGQTFQARGCATADTALIREILASPADFYVNVHNAAYPEGAIRGQLAAPAAPTLPDTGAQRSILRLTGLALGCVLVGLGLHPGMRRRPTV